MADFQVQKATGTGSGFLHEFCHPRDYQKYSEHFVLGDYAACFTDAVIVSVFHLIAIIFLCFRVKQLFFEKKRTVIRLVNRNLLKCRLVAATICLICVVFEVVSKISNLDNQAKMTYTGLSDRIAPFQILVYSMQVVGFLLMMLVTAREHSRLAVHGQWIDRFVFCFMATVYGYKLYIMVKMDHYYGLADFFLVLFAVQCAGVFFLALCSLFYWPYQRRHAFDVLQECCVGDAKAGLVAANTSSSDATYPGDTAPIWSRMSFGWMTPMIKLGNKRPLEAEDVWQLGQEFRSQHLFERFKFFWQREVDRIAARGERGGQPNQKKKRPNLLKVLIAMFWKQFAVGFFFKIFNDGSVFAGPIFLSLLIKFVSDDTKDNYIGYCYAFGMFACQIAGALGENQYFQRTMRVGISIRSVLTTAIFHKAMVADHSVWETTSTGQIVNLMTKDVAALDSLAGSVCNLWSAPMRIILAQVLLYIELGWPSLLGAVILVVCIPVQKKVVQKARALKMKGLKSSDERIKLASEALGAVAIVKCYAWEKSLTSRLIQERDTELYWLKKAAYLKATNSFIIGAVPILVSAVVFTVYAVLPDNTLTASKAFTSLALFGVMNGPLWTLPEMIAQLTSAFVSVGRLSDFFASQEIDRTAADPIQPGKPVVSIKRGRFAWNLKAMEPTLRDIELTVEQGALVAVIGGTASGKSSLVAAINSELSPSTVETEMRVYGSMALVPQQAWIFNDTLRENILFGLPYEKARYDRAVAAACLGFDFAQMPQGDMTEIGERGINLSGGQKQRVAIARATYADADTVIFDDPLSALDANVAAEVFEECLMKELAKKTRIMVINQLQFVHSADHIVLMEKGGINAQGTYQQMMETSELFRSMMSKYEDEGHSKPDPSSSSSSSSASSASSSSSASSFSSASSSKSKSVSASPPPPPPSVPLTVPVDGPVEGGAAEENEEDEVNQLPPVVVKGVPVEGVVEAGPETDKVEQEGAEVEAEDEGEKEKEESEVALLKKTPAAAVAGKDLIVKETRASGRVSWAVIHGYVQSMGGNHMFCALIFLFVFAEVARITGSMWIGLWTGDTLNESTAFYIGIYCVLSFVQTLAALSYNLMMAGAGITAGRTLHLAMFRGLLRAPMSFFNSTPLGRIINRVTKDQNDVDEWLSSWATVFFRLAMQLVGTITIIAIATPITLATFVPIMCIFYWCQRYFANASRELKRLDAISRSPVYAKFSQCLVGLPSIHVYRAQDRLARAVSTQIDDNIRMGTANFSSNRWLSVRLELLGGLMILIASLLVVISRDVISAAMAGLSLSYALQITGLLNAFTRLAVMVENSFNAVERLQEYGQLESEAPLLIPDTAPPKDWPDEGSIAFHDVSMRYRPGLPLVLKQVSFKVQPMEKVGVCGRSGAGKSTVFLTLYRIVELAAGKIEIDGVDISKIGLFNLRSKLSIIPQDPVLFSGTVRFNLDPFGERSEAQLWDALTRAHLSEHVLALEGRLEHLVIENGENFSVGQRQLLCLARALLRRSKILVLDEATAAVDVHTDALIQKTIRTQFSDCTMLIIAHRLNTIIDCNKILVLDNGNLAEFGTPAELLSKETGIFKGMAEATGPAGSAYLHNVALGKATVELSEEALLEEDLRGGSKSVMDTLVGSAEAARSKQGHRVSMLSMDPAAHPTLQLNLRAGVQPNKLRGAAEPVAHEKSRYLGLGALATLDQLQDSVFGSHKMQKVKEAVITLRQTLGEIESPAWQAELLNFSTTPLHWVRELKQLLYTLNETVIVKEAVITERSLSQQLEEYAADMNEAGTVPASTTHQTVLRHTQFI